ncbi:MAG: DUF4388 domain-containing protein [Verrucomicrobiota bacterium]
MSQLLIVHQDTEIGPQLVQMVKEYTGHESELTRTESETLFSVRRRAHLRPRVLLTQLAGDGLDGFGLAAHLSEMFPGLQTLFSPLYPASAQRMEISGSKVFPEPIDGDRLVATIERSVRMLPGAPDFFHALDVLQMCCLAGKSGAVQMVTGGQVGTVYLRAGELREAEIGSAQSKEALAEIASWSEVEFAYDAGLTAPAVSLDEPWHDLLAEAVAERQRQALPEWRR